MSNKRPTSARRTRSTVTKPARAKRSMQHADGSTPARRSPSLAADLRSTTRMAVTMRYLGVLVLDGLWLVLMTTVVIPLVAAFMAATSGVRRTDHLDAVVGGWFLPVLFLVGLLLIGTYTFLRWTWSLPRRSLRTTS